MNEGVIAFFGQLRPTKMMFKHSVGRVHSVHYSNYSLRLPCKSWLTAAVFIIGLSKCAPINAGRAGFNINEHGYNTSGARLYARGMQLYTRGAW